MSTKSAKYINICLAVLLLALASLTRPVSAADTKQLIQYQIQRIPFKVTVRNDFNGDSIIKVDPIESNLKFKPTLFTLINPKSGE